MTNICVIYLYITIEGHKMIDLQYFLRLRITEECSVPELIKIYLKYIHKIIRSIYTCFVHSSDCKKTISINMYVVLISFDNVPL